jgi:indolepyruvate ferredoxin oxidoreductase
MVPPDDAVSKQETPGVDYKFALDDRYAKSAGIVYLTGMQALVRLLIEQIDLDRRQGLRTRGYVSGYRGSPVGAFDSAIWQAGETITGRGIHFNPGINEDLAMTAVGGTQHVVATDQADLDGVFGIWYGKGPGVDRSVDAIKHASLAGASPHGGMLMLVGDDQMGKSSSLCHQSEQSLVSGSVPILAPSSVHEYVPLGLHAIAMSRYSGTLTAMKFTSNTADSAATVDLSRLVPEFASLPSPPARGTLHYQPGFVPFLEAERILLEERLPAAVAYARANRLNSAVIEPAVKKLGIVAVGAAYPEVNAALELLDVEEPASLGVGLFKVNFLWPLEPGGIVDFARGYDEVLVVEHKRAFVEAQLGRLLLDLSDAERPRLSGKTEPGSNTPLLSENGELSPAQIAAAISARCRVLQVADLKPLKARVTLPGTQPQQRIPWYCAGCPHNTSTQVTDGSLSASGIGCHSISALMDAENHTWMCQMGGEGQHWVGRAPFSPLRHTFVNLGDGTYNHSGSLAIRSAVSSGVNITFKLLYNDAVALTGGQSVDSDHRPWDIAQQLVGEGVAKIEIVSDRPEDFRDAPWPRGLKVRHRREFDRVQRELREVAGTSVLIYLQTCAAEKRRRRKKAQFPDPPKRMIINERICEGCGDCGLASNCVAIKPLDTLFGTKRKIDQSSCNKDFSCKNGFCPSFVMLEGVDGQDPLKPQNQSLVPLPGEALPTPPVFAGDPTRILVTGIGGTGVVTVGAVLSVAARLQGKHALSLDQTGLSQKNGAVASNLTIGSREIRHHPSKVGQGTADLLIACDLLGGVSDETLRALRADQARVVANTRVEPLPHFARDAQARPRVDSLMSRLTAVVPDHHVTTAATSDLAEALVGDGIGANMMLVGCAAQQGLLPVSVEAIEQAIRLNGVAIEMNLAAFTWGRWLVADPARAHAAASPRLTPAFEQASTSELIDIHYRELTDYQNRALADVYRRAVMRIEDDALRRVAANALFKALAYKDEYEVARLMLAQANAGARVTGRVRRFYYLAPPIFGARDADTGKPRKFRMPGWAIEPVFGLLRSLKWLRGGPLDVFAYSEERKNERALAADCLSMVRAIGDRGATVDKEAAMQDLDLVLEVKGFGHVKQKNWRHVEQRWQQARRRWSVRCSL